MIPASCSIASSAPSQVPQSVRKLAKPAQRGRRKPAVNERMASTMQHTTRQPVPMLDRCPHAQVPQPVHKPAKPTRGGKGKPAEKERVGLAMLKNIHMSPKKLALWARVVRGLHVEDAMIQCTVRVNKGAKILAEVRPSQLFLCTPCTQWTRLGVALRGPCRKEW